LYAATGELAPDRLQKILSDCALRVAFASARISSVRIARAAGVGRWNGLFGAQSERRLFIAGGPKQARSKRGKVRQETWEF
jgi:hypothetical protein